MAPPSEVKVDTPLKPATEKYHAHCRGKCSLRDTQTYRQLRTHRQIWDFPILLRFGEIKPAKMEKLKLLRRIRLGRPKSIRR